MTSLFSSFRIIGHKRTYKFITLSEQKCYCFATNSIDEMDDVRLSLALLSPHGNGAASSSQHRKFSVFISHNAMPRHVSLIPVLKVGESDSVPMTWIPLTRHSPSPQFHTEEDVLFWLLNLTTTSHFSNGVFDWIPDNKSYVRRRIAVFHWRLWLIGLRRMFQQLTIILSMQIKY